MNDKGKILKYMKMKKITMYIFLVMLFVATSSQCVYAQESIRTSTTSDSMSIRTKVDSIGYSKSSGFWDNWYVGAGVGPSLLMAESDRRGPFWWRITPAVDVSVGKWVIPAIGFRFQYSGFQARGYVNQDHMVDTAYGDLVNGYWYKQKFDYHHFMGHAMFNLTNAFKEYDAERFYNIITYLGLGVITSKDTDATEITGTFGLVNSFRLSPAFDLTLEVKGSIMHDRFDGETESVPNIDNEGLATMTLGFVYRIKPRGWKTSQVHITNIDYSEAKRYKDLLAKSELENANLRNTPAPEPVVITNTKIVTAPVFFELNKSNITNRELVKLSYIAEVIKSAPKGKTFKIIGCADKQTGNKRINDRLSKERAEAVYNALITKFGVDKDRLHLESSGGVDYMYLKDNELSRVAVIED